MSFIILLMFFATTNFAMGEATNMCEDILAKEYIDKAEFASGVAHLSHSLYLEPLRYIFYICINKIYQLDWNKLLLTTKKRLL